MGTLQEECLNRHFIWSTTTESLKIENVTQEQQILVEICFSINITRLN